MLTYNEFAGYRETIESLRQQLAAKDVEIERLKTVPMKYRRMAFNAQLQDENESLRQQLTELLNWQQKAFAAHPNIDIDIDRLNGGN